MSGELVPSEQVIEGELVDERAALVRRLEGTWRGSRMVPPVLRSGSVEPVQ